MGKRPPAEPVGPDFEVREIGPAYHHLVIFPVAAVRENVAQCPSCGARLEIRWKEARPA